MNYIALELIFFLIIFNMIITYGTVDFHSIVIVQKKHLFYGVNQLGLVVQPYMAIAYLFYLTVESANKKKYGII